MNVSRLVILKSCFALLLASFFFGASSHLAAQSLDAAGRPAEIAVTGGYIYGKPAYGPDNAQGGSLGVMYTRYFHFPIAPSLEGRATLISNNYIKETVYGGGIRVQGQVLRKLHPYGNFLVGTGTIDFKFPSASNYTSDNSTVYSYGGGVGVDVFNNIQLTAEYQHQSWNLGSQHAGFNYQFDPTLYIVGVKYTIPFRSYVGSSGRHKEK